MQNEEQIDKDWLDALAGRPPDGMNPEKRSQALAVRRALDARRVAIEVDAAQPDAQQFERLRQRLQREGLLTPERASVPGITWQRFLSGLGVGGHASGSGALVATRWVVLAAAVVGVVLALRLVVQGHEQGPPADVLRGGTATVQIVPDPQAKLAELRTGLLAAGAVFTVKTLPDGRIQVDIQASDSSLAYLDSVRIVPTVKDNSIRILIEKYRSP